MKRLPGLDLLRAIAISWVLFFHAGTLDLGWAWPPITKIGWMGVDLFFVLSGFLVGRQWLSSLQTNRSPFREFYLRRAFRILPAYLVVVAVYFVIPATQERSAIQPLWQFLTFTENLFIEASSGKTFSHVWSLCVEEHFYVAFPLIAYALWKRAARATVAACLIVLFGGMALRAFQWSSFDAGADNAGQLYFERIYYPTLPRLDGLLVGVVLAVTERTRAWATVMKRPLAIFGLGVLTFAGAVFLFDGDRTAASTIVGYPLLSMAMGCFVAAAVTMRVDVPGAAFIATISYSLYLSHKMAFFLLRESAGGVLKDHGVLAIFAYAAIALLFGAALHFGVERPFLSLRSRLTDSTKVVHDFSPSPLGRGSGEGMDLRGVPPLSPAPLPASQGEGDITARSSARAPRTS